jgi:Lipase (class 3)
MKFMSAQAPGYDVFEQQFDGLAKETRMDIEAILKFELPTDPDLVDYLLKLGAGMYDQKAAALLSAASTWAYSDADTMARQMRTRGIPNNRCVLVNEKNDALFLDTTAHLIQSDNGDLVILAFGGTDPTNAINLLSDVSAKKDSFFSVGSVHGGIFRGLLPVWRLLRILLKGAVGRYSVCDMIAANKLFHHGKALFDPKPPNPLVDQLLPLESASPVKPRPRTAGARRSGGRAESGPAAEGRDEMKALYITGHSLGGAMAVLATAAIYTDPYLLPLREKLRGVYTFGQPAVGDRVFADAFDAAFGRKFFRHVYRKDVIPHLPPLTMGLFTHFGQHLVEDGGIWALRPTPGNQLFTWRNQALAGADALAFGLVAWVRDQFPLLSWLPLPYSLSDHSPLNYLRTSLDSDPGSELL